MLERVAHVPEPGRNLISTRKASKTTKKLWTPSNAETRFDLGEEESLVFTASDSSGLYEVDALRSTTSTTIVLVTRKLATCDAMEMH